MQKNLCTYKNIMCTNSTIMPYCHVFHNGQHMHLHLCTVVALIRRITRGQTTRRMWQYGGRNVKFQNLNTNNNQPSTEKSRKVCIWGAWKESILFLSPKLGGLSNKTQLFLNWSDAAVLGGVLKWTKIIVIEQISLCWWQTMSSEEC